MDYGSDLLLARGSREGGPETCRSHRRAARRPKGGQWSLRISRRRLTLRGDVNERGRPSSAASIATPPVKLARNSSFMQRMTKTRSCSERAAIFLSISER
jgi:hypothetical protein